MVKTNYFFIGIRALCFTCISTVFDLDQSIQRLGERNYVENAAELICVVI